MNGARSGSWSAAAEARLSAEARVMTGGLGCLMFQIRELEYFLAVLGHGGITRAAVGESLVGNLVRYGRDD
jgi:hypothetical protein